ncbi:cell envelope biogenesis protein OmpA [Bacteroidia bacterium]|nr:cell envelope biogenesis protein OmpA [Bacteroidia bacterium]GHT49317.1 cell envelope biogenesis protein OmpA [Bacteroidia bacterium]
MKKMKFFLLSMLLTMSTLSFAQVTTSSISGRVTDGTETLIGATIKATHEPSGTTYGAVTNNDGRYTIQGMRTGGPYRVEILYLGFADYVKSDVYLQLGETYVLNAQLSESDLLLNEVVISAIGSKFAGDRNGSMTNINSRDMTLVPTLNRSLSDYTKLSPYASGNGSFGGRPAYATNISIDGANFNNNFGLNNNSMPGPSESSADPISMDAIEEMQVAVAPYDVRQSNFTGAGVNVVTKSGTNTTHGSAYFYFRNQDMNGKKIRDRELTINESERQVYGVTLGGPIIKNKLFYFVSGELENNLKPGNTLLAGGSGRDANDPNVSKNVTGAQMQEFSDFLSSKYGYKTGRYEKWGGDNESSRKLLAKIDWNINQDHKATLRYNYSQAGSVSRPSTSGDVSPSISGSRHSSTGGMSFENSQYSAVGYLHSITAELNSRFTDELSNNFLAAYTKYYQPRETDSSIFPMVDIMDGDATKGNVRMSAGYELFSYKNIINNNTLILTDNLTYNLGAHTITGGLSYENQFVRNSYWRQGTGYYRFKDLDAFKAYANGEGVGKPYNPDYHPIAFALSYPINGYTYDDVPELTFGQFSAYAQDEWHLTDAFKLTYGLRIDAPMYLSGAIDNPLVKDYTFRDGEKMEFGSWPKTQILWSPRVGFNYDVNEDKSIKLRGGLGIFTGRIPFVWFTNQPQNSGMLQYQLAISGSSGDAAKAQLARLPFSADAHDLLNDPTIADIFPQANVARGNLSSIDKNFKLPQVFRSSVAADFKLPLDMVLTLEGIYTKDINAIAFDNINLNNPQSNLTEGDNSRPYWPNTTAEPRSINTNYSYAVVMRNTNKGHSYNLSAQLSLPNYNGFSGNIAYTYGYAEEVVGKNGSDPYSAWRYRHIVDSPNSEELGLSMNNTPHRIIISANYQKEYAKMFKSTVSLFYSGYSGSSLSYLYATDANNDGTVNDLMYIPKSKDDFIWKNGDADANAYFAFAAEDPYLSKHAGEYAKRYAAYEPFYNRIDFRFLQDFYLNVAGRKHTLQLSVDILNIPNMINSNWGINKIYIGSNLQATPLRFEGRDATTNKPIVSMTKLNNEYMTTEFQDPTSVSSIWSLQLGLRYIF